METLGLSSPPQPPDNLFKRLFWPAVQNQYDVDLVGYQGFWVCFLLGLFSGIVQIVTGHAIAGIVTAILYILGGFGVRERSPAAAILIFLLYLLDVSGNILVNPAGIGVGSPLLRLFILMLLLANIRATILTEKWHGEELPERSNITLGDKLANRLPPLVWPVGRWVFFVLAPLTLLLATVGFGMMFYQQQKLRHMPPPADDDSITLPVQPSR